jgi:hypothetical protein
LWTANGQVTTLGVREGFNGSSLRDVSADGTVIAGRSDLWTTDRGGPYNRHDRVETWLWSNDSGYIDLGEGLITGLSADGSVAVGFTAPSPYQSFVWNANTGIVLLNTGWDVGPQVSPDGTLVFGNGNTGYPGYASVWDRINGDRDIHDLFMSEYGLTEDLAGWQLHYVQESSLNNRVLVGKGISPSGDEATWVAILDPPIQAGDADQDMDFDQMDLVKVQVAGKYLTGEPATWGEGDWNGVPVVLSARPPEGDGLFNQLDIVAAQQAGLYLTGSYGADSPAAISPNSVTPASIPVPEPSSLLLSVMAGLLAIARPARAQRR